MVNPLMAKIHGPIIQWNDDPSSKAIFHWIDRYEWPVKIGEWGMGRAGFGYGDGDDVTELKKMKGGETILRIRRSVNLPKELPKNSKLFLETRHDDGVIAFIDGVEIARKDVDGRGPEAKVGMSEAKNWSRFPIKNIKGLLKKRNIVLALEGYNHTSESSDFSLDARLIIEHEGKISAILKGNSLWEYYLGSTPGESWEKSIAELQRPDGWEPKEYTFRFREKGSKSWLSLDPESDQFADTDNFVFHCHLTDLPSNSVCEYEIHQEGHEKSVSKGSFLTADSKEPELLRYVTGGDMFHHRQALDAMNARAGLEDPLFAMLGGDLAYANGIFADRWYQWVDSWKENAVTPDGRDIPMIVAIGNHEVEGAGYWPEDARSKDKAKFFYSLFTFPEDKSNYAVDFGDYLSFIVLDSGHTQNIKDQVRWLSSSLKKRVGQKWIYTCYHRPAYGTGVKGDAKHIQKLWSPLLERYKVDGVFENDHHTLSRTYPIKAGKRNDKQGVPYFGDGCWGVRVRKIPEKSIEARPWLAKSESLNHLFRVDLAGEKSTITAMSAEGEELDQSVTIARPHE